VATKQTTPEQIFKLETYMKPYQYENECAMEAAIRRIETLSSNIEMFLAQDKKKHLKIEPKSKCEFCGREIIFRADDKEQFSIRPEYNHTLVRICTNNRFLESWQDSLDFCNIQHFVLWYEDLKKKHNGVSIND